MVRLNKVQLSEEQLASLFVQLSNSLGKQDSERTSTFLTALLGYEERVMLAKRLAMIVLLAEGKTLYRVANILKVSPATAEKIKVRLDQGDYDQLLTTLGRTKKSYFSFLQTLDDILHLGGILPHYNGLDRYRGL